MLGAELAFPVSVSVALAATEPETPSEALADSVDDAFTEDVTAEEAEVLALTETSAVCGRVHR